MAIDDRTKLFTDLSSSQGLKRHFMNTDDQRALGPTLDGDTVTPDMMTALEKLGYHPLNGRFVPGESIHGFHLRTISVKMKTADGWFKTRNYTVVVELYNENGRVIEHEESYRKIKADDRLSSKEAEALCISALDKLAPAANSQK